MTDTQAIKDRLDVVEIIREYVPLKKAGTNWKANCPFHHEKSPSFMVHPEKQIWHCFGCGKGGDAFSFIQEIEGMDFVEALRFLATRAGVPVSTFQSEVQQSQKNRLVEINAKAAYFFHHFLLELPAAEPARNYLTKRGLATKVIEDWQVGSASEQWDLLTKYLLKKGFGIEDLVAAGVTIAREGTSTATGMGYYDRFRGRIMFPLCDAHGTVVGFTGRVLVETETSGGKYVNTPETPLFNKSRILYGLHKAKQEIKTKDLAVIVEGQMDVIACHAHGMTNVVAASGTALTAEQVKLIKRYTNNVAMAFDADAAGENAGKRGATVALEAGLNVKIIQLPPGAGKDADECLRQNTPVWFKAVAEAKPLLDWYFSKTLGPSNLADPKQKQRVAEILLEQIMLIPYAVERDEWIKKLAAELAVEVGALREIAAKLKLNKTKPVAAKVSSQPLEPVSIIPAMDSFESLLTEWWSVIIKFPELYGTERNPLMPEFVSKNRFADLYQKCEEVYNKGGVLDREELRALVGATGAENVVDILELRPYKNITDINLALARHEISELNSRLRVAWRKKSGLELQSAIASAEAKGDKALVANLIQKLQGL